MPQSLQSLELLIIIYARDTSDIFLLYADEHHVALLVNWEANGISHRYHATEDTDTEGEMKFEYNINPYSSYLKSSRAHRTIVVKTNIPQDRFGELHQILVGTKVPKSCDRPKGWNCQSWVGDAMQRMEPEFLKEGEASSYQKKMMDCIEEVADRRLKGKGKAGKDILSEMK